MPSPAMSTSPFCRRRMATSGSWPISTVKPSRLGRLAEVVRVAREGRGAGPMDPVLQQEGAGADRMLAEVAVGGLHGLLRHGGGEVERQHVEEGGVGLREPEADRAVVDDLDARHRLGRAVRHLVGADDGVEEAGAGPLRLGVGGPLDRVFHVARHHFAAVGELHAGVELERVGEAVRRHLVAVRQRGHELGGARLVVHQPREQRVDHRPVLPVVADRGVERRDVVLVGDGDRAALARRIGVGLRGHGCGEGQGERRGGRGGLQPRGVIGRVSFMAFTGRGCAGRAGGRRGRRAGCRAPRPGPTPASRP